jgi:hypothetical protein
MIDYLKLRVLQKAYRIFFVFVSLLIINFSVSTAAQADEEAQVREAFSALQKAFLAHDSELALALLSSDTKEYYRLLSKLARSTQNGTLAKIDKSQLTPLNMMMLKFSQKNIPKTFWEGTEKNNPDKLLKLAVDKGLGSKELSDGIMLGAITFDGMKASGKILKGTKVLPLQLGFQKEAGQWKISLMAMFEQANRLAEGFMKRSGMKAEDLEKMVKQP